MSKDKDYAFNPKMSRRSVLTGGASTAARAVVRGGEEAEAPKYTATFYGNVEEHDPYEEHLGDHKTIESAEAQLHRHAKQQGHVLKKHPTEGLTWHSTEDTPDSMYDVWHIHPKRKEV